MTEPQSMPALSSPADSRDSQRPAIPEGPFSTGASHIQSARRSAPSSPTIGVSACETTAAAVTVVARLRGIHDCEQRYRAGCTAEIEALELQLSLFKRQIH